MKNLVLKLTGWGLTFLIPLLSAGAAQASPDGAPAAPVDVRLSAPVLSLIDREMQAIQGGMQEIVAAVAEGDWKTVARVGSTIQRSYILKQKLTPEQRRELHEKLPASFIAQDRGFHDTAGKLASVAGKRDMELVNFYFHRMMDACVRCHAGFAPGRFPGLGRKR